jgi:peptidoglycan/xylan/chitin deacetylase (PgdA/CDA1 family)
MKTQSLSIENGPLVDELGFSINYHFVRPKKGNRFAGLYGLTPESLAEHCRRVGESFDTVTARALFEPGRDRAGPAALFTFDDSLRDVIEFAAPVMANLGVPATIFVPSQPYLEGKVLMTHQRQLLMGKMGASRFAAAFYERLDGLDFVREDPAALGIQVAYLYDTEETARLKMDINFAIPYDVLAPVIEGLFVEYVGDMNDVIDHLYMSRDELLRLCNLGWEIGGHSHRHYVMSRLPAAEQADEAAINFEFIRTVLGDAPHAFAYPHGTPGTYNAESLAAVESAGFKSAFTIGRDVIRSSDLDARYEIPRFVNNDLFDNKNVFQHDMISGLSGNG